MLQAVNFIIFFIFSFETLVGIEVLIPLAVWVGLLGYLIIYDIKGGLHT